MKKVIVIFMAMAMLFLFAGMAFGENPKGLNSFEIQTMIEDWVEAQKYEGYTINGTVENGTFRTIGVLDGTLFEQETGYKFTPERLEASYYDSNLTGMELDIVKSEVELIGFYEGYDVYKLELITENTPLGEYNGENVYHLSIVFMVREE